MIPSEILAIKYELCIRRPVYNETSRQVGYVEFEMKASTIRG